MPAIVQAFSGNPAYQWNKLQKYAQLQEFRDGGYSKPPKDAQLQEFHD
ncbi:hypothetical protein [Paenibacillus alba]|uniref:Uncharacterized protein n=1 Tax=Paenibacillus alba TaxID=1197127 RepID=A0ABU6G329_9BACL|nr:hypothetical protein [Paenibacillus alba]MEC0227154.1 hypothetical protein [Paenibacillus alba]